MLRTGIVGKEGARELRSRCLLRSGGWTVALVLAGVPALRAQGATIGGLTAGGSVTVEFLATVDSPLPPGVVQVSNQGTVVATGVAAVVTDDPGEPGSADPTVTPVVAQPDLSIAKSDGGISAVPGGTVAYLLAFANEGDQAASGVTLSEVVPANSTFAPGASSAGWVCVPDNNPGASCTFAVGALAGGGAAGSATFAVTLVDPLPAGVGAISNTATIADDGANGADPDPSDNSATDTTPVDAAPDLTLAKGDGGTSTVPGATVSYTLDYANAGNQGATGVVLTETVPANSVFNAAASTAGWVCVPDGNPGSTCTLAVGALAGGGAGGSVTFAVTVANPLPAAVEQISNTASVADDGANGADPAPGDNSASDSTPVTAQPDLALTKNDGGVSGVPGGIVAYTLGWSNGGNQGATGVTLSESVPAHTAFDAAASTPGWSCPDGSPAGTPCSLPVGAVAGGGASGSALFAVEIVDPVPAGVVEISNSASVSDDGANGSDPEPGNNSAADQTPVDAAPDLAIDKSHTGPVPFPGDTIDFDLAYSNGGNQDATGVALAEVVPDGTTFDAAASTPGWSCANGAPAGTPCTLAIGPLAGGGAGGSAVFAVLLDDPLPPGTTEVDNCASIADDGSNGVDPVPGDNDDCETVALDLTAPTVVLVDTVPASADGEVAECDTALVAASALAIEFSEVMNDPPGDTDPSDVTHPDNYRLFAAGPDGAFSTALCGPPAGDDVAIPATAVSYVASPSLATVDFGVALSAGPYRLLVCPALEDVAGNPLDGDTTPGGGDEHELGFRLDPGNFLDNGHFDCDLRAWQAVPAGTGDIEQDPNVDLDDAPVSGSVRIDPLIAPPQGPSTFSVAQCVAIAPADYELVTRVRIAAGAGVPVTIARRVDYFTQPDCAGAAGSFEVAQPRFDSGNAWLEIVDAVRAPAGSASARWTVEARTTTGALFTAHLDQLYVRPSPLLFRDGFETGDTSRWSATTP
jgi:uncharacterized repeat protein (TIGR01451 family)